MPREYHTGHKIRYGCVVSFFQPALFSKFYEKVGCGYTALSLLTGENPYAFKSLNKESNDCSGKFIQKMLTDRGFTVISLSKSKLINRPRYSSLSDKVTRDHVVLTCQQLTRKEASWFVYHNDLIYHNYGINPCRPLDLLNFPILEKYVIFHPKWVI